MNPRTEIEHIRSHMSVNVHYYCFLYQKRQNTTYTLNNIQKDIELTVDYQLVYLL